MVCEDFFDMERIEVRWLRPDGKEAVTVEMRYASSEEASTAFERCLKALERPDSPADSVRQEAP